MAVAEVRWQRRVFAAFHYSRQAFEAPDEDLGTPWMLAEERSLCALAWLFAAPEEGELYRRVDARLPPLLRQYLVLELAALRLDHVLGTADHDPALRDELLECWQLLRHIDMTDNEGFEEALDATRLEIHFGATTSLATVRRFVVDHLRRRAPRAFAPPPPPVPLATLFDAQHAVWAVLQHQKKEFSTADGHMMCTHMAMLRVYTLLRQHEPLLDALDREAPQAALDLRLATLFAVATLPTELAATPEVVALGRPASDRDVARSERYAQQQRWMRAVLVGARSRYEALRGTKRPALRRLPLSNEDVFLLAYETACRARAHYVERCAPEPLAYPGELARRLLVVVDGVAESRAVPGSVRASLQQGEDPRCLPWPRWPRTPAHVPHDPSVDGAPLRAWRTTTPALGTLGMMLEPRRVHDAAAERWLPVLPWRLNMPPEPPGLDDDTQLFDELDGEQVRARRAQLAATAAQVERRLRALPPESDDDDDDTYVFVPRGTPPPPGLEPVQDEGERLFAALQHVMRNRHKRSRVGLPLLRSGPKRGADSSTFGNSQGSSNSEGSGSLPQPPSLPRQQQASSEGLFSQLGKAVFGLLGRVKVFKATAEHVRAATDPRVAIQRHALAVQERELQDAEKRLAEIVDQVKKLAIVKRRRGLNAEGMAKYKALYDDMLPQQQRRVDYLRVLVKGNPVTRTVRVLVTNRRWVMLVAASCGAIYLYNATDEGTILGAATALTAHARGTQVAVEVSNTQAAILVRALQLRYFPRADDPALEAEYLTALERAPSRLVALAEYLHTSYYYSFYNRLVANGLDVLTAMFLSTAANASYRTAVLGAVETTGRALQAVADGLSVVAAALPAWITSSPMSLVLAGTMFGSYAAFGLPGVAVASLVSAFIGREGAAQALSTTVAAFNVFAVIEAVNDSLLQGAATAFVPAGWMPVLRPIVVVTLVVLANERLWRMRTVPRWFQSILDWTRRVQSTPTVQQDAPEPLSAAILAALEDIEREDAQKAAKQQENAARAEAEAAVLATPTSEPPRSRPTAVSTRGTPRRRSRSPARSRDPHPDVSTNLVALLLAHDDEYAV